MEDVKIELGEIELWAADEDDIVPQLATLKSSQRRKHLSTLYISCEESFVGNEFRVRHTSLDRHYTKLVHLCINCVHSSHTVLLDILENVPPTMVEFTSITFYDTKRKPKSVQHSRLKELRVNGAFDDEGSLEGWNNGFKAILDACPSLENFHFDGDRLRSNDVGALDMDFRGLEKLKEIHLRMLVWDFEYYTVNQADKQGLKWKTFEGTYDEESFDDKCYVNLLWNGHPSVELR